MAGAATRTTKKGGAREGAGRKDASLAERVRVWVWYCFLREAAKAKGWENDCQLDCNCVPPLGNPAFSPAARPQVFERIRKKGRNPNHTFCKELDADGQCKTYNLFDRIEARDLGTRAVFEHRLWEVIDPRSMTLRRARELIDELLALEGFRRMESLASFIYINQVPTSNPNHPLRRNARHVSRWVKRPTLNRLALLCLLLREAISSRSHSYAARYESAVKRAAFRFARQSQFSHVEGLGKKIERVVQDFIESFIPEDVRLELLIPLNVPIIEIGTRSDALEAELRSRAPEFWQAFEKRLDLLESQNRGGHAG
jgi:hypothetical protein